MRIGIDATCWHNKRGYGRHARALLTALANSSGEDHLVFFMDSREDTGDVPPAAEIRLVPSRSPAACSASASGHRTLGDMWRMSRAMADGSLDLLLFPTIYSFVPVFSPARKLVFIHDVIAEEYPEWALGHPLAQLLWEVKTALGRLQADAVVTVSEFSRDKIVQRFGIPRDQVFVVGEAADETFAPIAAPEPTALLRARGINSSDRIVAYVGGFGPHKNIRSLLNAFGQMSRHPNLAGTKLVLAGEHENEVFHSEITGIQEEIRKLDLAGRVVFTGFLPDGDLAVLLNLALVLVLPSFMEGFGLPAIEAAACGCPVIATRNSPLPELLGAGGIYIDPRHPEQLERALLDVLRSENSRAEMATNAVVAAGKLKWTNAACQLRCAMRAMIES